MDEDNKKKKAALKIIEYLVANLFAEIPEFLDLCGGGCNFLETCQAIETVLEKIEEPTIHEQIATNENFWLQDYELRVSSNKICLYYIIILSKYLYDPWDRSVSLPTKEEIEFFGLENITYFEPVFSKQE